MGGLRMFDPVSYAMGAKAGGGGGDNPNYVETITGTLANPWGGVDVADLASDVIANNATVYMTVSFSGLTRTFLVDFSEYESNNSTIFISACTIDANEIIAYAATWTGAVFENFMSAAGTVTDGLTITNYSAYGEYVPTTLTIIHHPLPEEDNT